MTTIEEYNIDTGIKLFNKWSFDDVEIKDVAVMVSCDVNWKY